MFSLQAVVSYGVSNRIVPRCARMGTLEPNAPPRLVGATITNKIFIHESEVVLHINEKILALAVAPFDTPYDIIIVGTSVGVLAHDVFSNVDLFRRELPDGVNCIEVGEFSTRGVVAMCGSNCALWGFDSNGKDVFWTVTGANVSALCFCDIDNDRTNEVVIGTEDYDIRIFKEDLLVYELNETDAVTCLCNLGNGRFAYGLANGTLGAYEKDTRLWRIKTKNQPVAFAVYPNPQTFACAWTGGKIEIRKIEDGETKCKESHNGEVANLFAWKDTLSLVTVDGFAYDYKVNSDEADVVETQNAARELDIKKRNLLAELQSFEQNRKELSITPIVSEKKISVAMSLEAVLSVNCEISPPSVELQVSLSEDAVIRAVIVFAEGIFDGESRVVHPTSNFSDKLSVHLRPEKDVAVHLLIKAFVGFAESKQLHIFELSRLLPRFSMYALCTEDAPKPNSHATFTISEKPYRLCAWINENFLLAEEFTCENESKLSANFYSIRTRKMVFIEMDIEGTVTIRCDDMEIVGNLIQSIAECCGITTLSTTASFPSEMAALTELTKNLNDMYTLQDQLSASMAERMSMVKELLVRAEDARIIQQIQQMKKYYVKLQSMNQAMIAEHKVRCNNYEKLLQTSRELNKTIEKGARLRVGDPARKIISSCRDAISSENFDMLPKIIFYGV